MFYMLTEPKKAVQHWEVQIGVYEKLTVRESDHLQLSATSDLKI